MGYMHTRTIRIELMVVAPLTCCMPLTCMFAQLDLSANRLEPEVAKALASALVTSSLMVANMLYNNLNVESAKMLTEAVKDKGISLCGIRPDQSSADFRDSVGATILRTLAPHDAILLGSDLSQASVSGSFTSIGEGGLNLKGSKLGDEGWGAIFQGVCSNRNSKIASIDTTNESIGPAGAVLVATALRELVASSLVVANMLYNNLNVESAKMLTEAVKDKGISLCGIRPHQSSADFSLEQSKSLNWKPYVKRLAPHDAILLGSDLSQASVSGSFTSIGEGGLNLKGNKLGDEGWGAICQGVCSNRNSKIASIEIADPSIGPAGAVLITTALQENVNAFSLNVINLIGSFSVINKIGMEAATKLASVAKEKASVEAATKLASVAKEKAISLCGIASKQAHASFNGFDLSPTDVILLTADLAVRDSLTSVRQRIRPRTQLPSC